ncbi:hypothetical protein M406DRAFT_62808 [Cryphonectria parasitica EP155]|uniref:Uncharacterized protein n=1 Tax=Cryphonectria parasitica (strain ATCC 38755 / EP155) TaxID=660469 RepID=A0A9P4Y879_CRYP1|nr:uncharacterized protein M406DRAFT_62808 [Cryphonectria parasitica EP155]KAF3768742.1 hypothetical protein M406DRAFT_62808 [Cryphonectria parasitica EP155]
MIGAAGRFPVGWGVDVDLEDIILFTLRANSPALLLLLFFSCTGCYLLFYFFLRTENTNRNGRL